MRKIDYNPDKHKTAAEEWGIHKNCREWWYATGILFDDSRNMYSYQMTLLYLNFKVVVPVVAMIALTDYSNGKHYYLQKTKFLKLGVTVTKNELAFDDILHVLKEDDGLTISLKHSKFSFDAKTLFNHKEVWHCENGKLQMGIPDKKATTLYYSWTNMPTTAFVEIDGISRVLRGQTWFDKQGGTYNMADMRSHWEWFSLRFFNDTQIMLFTFPQNEIPEFDGTYIDENGCYKRLNHYKIYRLDVLEEKGLKWSSKWKVVIPELYNELIIEPIQKGYMNFAYFEELCYVKDKTGRTVGFAFAELLPGVLNQDIIRKGNSSGISMKNLFKHVEF